MNNLRKEVDSIIAYTDVYTENLKWARDLFFKQYQSWEEDSDSIFVQYNEDFEDFIAPMSYFGNRNPFNPPRVNFDAIKLDGTFRLLPRDIGLKMTEIYDGVELGYLLENTGKIEERYANQFTDRLANKWVSDLPWVDIDDIDFWIENRDYIQKDNFIKYILYKRLDLWEWRVFDQLDEYKSDLVESTQMLDSVIAVRESEYEFIWWVLNPKD